MSIAAGDLNRQIIIEERTVGVDALNQPNGAWTAISNGTVWANIKGYTGLRSISQGVDGVGATLDRYSIRVRFRTDVNVAMRVNHNGNFYDIIDIRQDYADQCWTDLICNIGLNDG